jgi:hypothetical protein
MGNHRRMGMGGVQGHGLLRNRSRHRPQEMRRNRTLAWRKNLALVRGTRPTMGTDHLKLLGMLRRRPRKTPFRRIIICHPKCIQALVLPKLQAYIDKEDDLPFDQHWLVALVAPRAVYVSSADEDLWADPRGEWLALLNAAPAWKLLGRTGLGEGTAMPPLNKPIQGDGMAYHIRTGEHNYKVFDWMAHADFADAEYNRNQDA